MTGKKSEKMKRRGSWILLILIFFSSTHLFSLQESGEKRGLLPESKEYYTREEAEELILNVMKIADDEIEKSAIEAGKSAAASIAGDAEYYRIVSEKLTSEVSELKKDNKRLERDNRRLKTVITVTGGLSIGAVFFALLSGS